MNFILLDKRRLDNVFEFLNKLPLDGKTEVVIREYKKKRSVQQNALLWMWIPYFAKHFGYTDEEMHEEFKYAFIGETVYVNRKGIQRTRPISTTTLSTKQMAEYLTKIEVLANKEEIKLPIPDDYLFSMMRG